MPLNTRPPPKPAASTGEKLQAGAWAGIGFLKSARAVPVLSQNQGRTEMQMAEVEKLAVEIAARHIPQAVGWRLMVLRQQRGLSRAAAAKLAGISPATWLKIESGRGDKVRIQAHLNICDAFDCSLDWLFCGCDRLQDTLTRARQIVCEGSKVLAFAREAQS
jgi:DNA-binding Xre family transcriptional regulator